MDKQSILDALKNYEWGKIWFHLITALQDGMLPDSEFHQALFRFLALAWWSDSAIAPTINSLGKSLDSDVNFLNALTALAAGNEKVALLFLKDAKQHGIKKWQLNWFEIEYLGRKAEYKKQSVILRRVLLRQSDKNFAITACLQSLANPNANTNFIEKVLKNYPINYSSPLAALQFRVKLITSDSVLTRIQGGQSLSEFPNSLLYLCFFSFSADGKLDRLLSIVDILINEGFIDVPLTQRMLTLLISTPNSSQLLKSKVKKITETNPKNGELLAIVSCYLLIDAWISGDLKNCHKVLQFCSDLTPRSWRYWKMEGVFISYILKCLIFRQMNSFLYSGDAGSVVFFVGDSHALAPNHMYLNKEKTVRVMSSFVMGVKMYHLGSSKPSQHRELMERRIASLPEGAMVVMTVGEIDCRVDEGIWIAHQKSGRTLHSLAYETVASYAKWLDSQSAQKNFIVHVQGIPAPTIRQLEKIPNYEWGRFIDMVKLVNQELHEQCQKFDWKFIDIFKETANDTGINNERLTLDGYHIKPSFYFETDFFD